MLEVKMYMLLLVNHKLLRFEVFMANIAIMAIFWRSSLIGSHLQNTILLCYMNTLNKYSSFTYLYIRKKPSYKENASMCFY